MKRSSRRLSKKGLVGLARVRVAGEKYWLYQGNRYDTLREVIIVHRLELLRLLQES